MTGIIIATIGVLFKKALKNVTGTSNLSCRKRREIEWDRRRNITLDAGNISENERI
jgi:hypothetical protein